ncbi:heme-binding protein [Limoniibacter endophyticus]|uniref:Heme-binding protein n=1 Tax=Limoniibacter endophyticus TaxID=1565040 RepID=A0A8J3DH84_9HYPH|nr:heme-binding protein [Limoniibacter endophyticus]GHC67436.1 hypothetical protein GCM10010136_11490 [Limoniibacter endophyticus]
MDHQRAKADIIIQEAALERLPLAADTLLALARRMVESAPAPLSVKIVVGRRTIVQISADGTNRDNEHFLDLKINTVFNCGHASLWWFHHLRSTGRTLADVAWADPSKVIDMGGGIPLLRDGQIVGAIAVSGLPHEDDHALIMSSLQFFLET